MPKNGDKPVDKIIPITSKVIGMKINMFPQEFHRLNYRLTGVTKKVHHQNMGQNGTQERHIGTSAESVPSSLQSYAPGKRKRRSPIAQASDLTIKAMLLQGTSIRKIAAALYVSPSTVQRVKGRMCTQAPDAEDLKSGLMSPRLAEMSVAVVEHFLKKGTKLKTIKGSDAIAAVKTVADRQWPVRQDGAPPTHLYVNIDLEQFRPDPLDSAQDVTPTPTGCVSGDGKQDKDENLNEFNTCNVS
jgi:transposase